MCSYVFLLVYNDGRFRMHMNTNKRSPATPLKLATAGGDWWLGVDSGYKPMIDHTVALVAAQGKVGILEL